VEQHVEDLAVLTRAAFDADGPVAVAMAEHGRRYVYQEPQIDYALRCARAITSPPGKLGLVTLLEAETGTGKSVGYLVPLCLACATGGARAVISTYTLLLQHQILSDDFKIAAAAVRAMTGRILRAAPRKGLRNFVSASRVLALREAMEAEGRLDKAAADALSSLAHATPGDGTIRTWVDRFGKLPEGVREADICLLSSEGEEAEAFRTHLQVAAGADIVVVTHALLVQSMLGRNAVIGRMAEGSTPFVNGVVDEADQLPKVAADVFSVRVSMPMLRAVGARLPAAAGERFLRVVEATQAWFDHVRPARGQPTVNLATTANDSTRAAAAHRAGALAEALMAAEAAGSAAEDAAALRHLAAELSQFRDACDDMSDNQAPVLRWSPVRAYAGFSVVPLRPGRLCSQLWKPHENAPPFLDHIVMTSATLDAPDSQMRFYGFRNEIGLLGDNYAAEISGRFAPRRFGRLRFVLADPEVHVPSSEIDGDDYDPEQTSDPEWLGYAAEGVAAAASEGGRTLVLALSFRDTAAVCERLRGRCGQRLIEHCRGERLADALAVFRADPEGILISPAAWEGVNLPGLLAQLVILRLPFAPLDTADRQALLDALMSKGWEPGKAAGVLFRASLFNAQRRLRQGIGRSIRSPTDDVTLWILDPRFPLPVEVARSEGLGADARRSMAGFELCVPERFRRGMRATLPKARVFRNSTGRAVGAPGR
jgi:ATP-dependent DNA helicase DinG